jgi:hypothetical protein
VGLLSGIKKRENADSADIADAADRFQVGTQARRNRDFFLGVSRARFYVPTEVDPNRSAQSAKSAFVIFLMS